MAAMGRLGDNYDALGGRGTQPRPLERSGSPNQHNVTVSAGISRAAVHNRAARPP
jgi:hypothetical protein